MIPRETAAFAAGIRVCCGSWPVIAATLAQVGLGAWSPVDLEMAAREWQDENLADRRAMSAEEAIVRTRPGVRS
jgi:hypothetical protein